MFVFVVVMSKEEREREQQRDEWRSETLRAMMMY